MERALSTQTLAHAPTLSPPARGPGGAASPGQRYRVVERLGKGGMGEVFVWHDPNTGRELAAKRALNSLDASSRRRFQREALLQARLEHPAFVPVYDIATDADGAAYFTMRRIQGRTLREILADPSASPARHRMLATFAQLCRAIDYAHSRGVVHRDLKPENIMLGDFGEAYVLDWGIARISPGADLELDDAGSTDPIEPHTRTGAVMGTPGYMSPEQLRGEHATLDGRADVYSLGAVLFEILVGERLHLGDSLESLARSTLDLRADRSPARRAPDREVPPELDALCLHATQPQRHRRLPSAHALADALDRYLEGDRDLALRRARAAELAQQSADLLTAAGDDTGRRVDAAREALRAIAFDPDQLLARSTLLQVLSQPPPAAPREVEAELEVERRINDAAGLKTAAAGMGLFQLLLVGLLLHAGIRNLPLALTALAFGLASSALCLASSRVMRRRHTLLGLAAYGALCLHNALFSQWFSPWVAMPLVIGVTLINTMFYASARHRGLMLAMAVAVVLGPQALESLRVIPQTMTITADLVRIVPRLAGPLPIWASAVHFVLLLLVVAHVTVQLVNRARAIELRARSHAWLLRRVLEHG